MTRKRGAVYARISSDREGTGQKVDDQIADCLALAERLDLDVSKEHIYRDDSISAHAGKRRPGYDKLLAAIRAEQVDAVLAVDADRIHRRLRELLDYLDACQPRDVPTYTVRAGKIDLSTRAGRTTAKISATLAEEEVDHMIERMREARLHKVERGEWTGNRRPYGYESDGVTIRPAERDAVAWACGQILQGMSLSATAKALNAKKLFSSTGRPWDARTLGRMLRRPRNAGLSVHRGQVVATAVWPALVPEITWRGVVAVLEDPGRRTAPGGPPRWLGTNLYRCHCGELVVSKARGGPYKMAVYVCSGPTMHLSRNAQEVDAYVRDVTVGVLVAKGRDLLVPEGSHERMAELHARDAVLDGTLRRLGDALAEGTMDFPTVETATARIRSERAEITEELTGMATGSVLSGVADAVDVAGAFDALDLSRKRAIVDLLMVVTLNRSRRGRPKGWERGGSYFDPDSVTITPR